MGDEEVVAQTYVRKDLERILDKIDGMEGQTERARAIKAAIEAMDADND